MRDDAWLRPLSALEDRTIWQLVESIGSATRGDPALLVELMAILFGSTVLQLGEGRGQVEAAETAEQIVDFVLGRVDILVAEEAAEALAEMPVSGTA